MRRSSSLFDSSSCDQKITTIISPAVILDSSSLFCAVMRRTDISPAALPERAIVLGSNLGHVHVRVGGQPGSSTLLDAATSTAGQDATVVNSTWGSRSNTSDLSILFQAFRCVDEPVCYRYYLAIHARKYCLAAERQSSLSSVGLN